MRELMKRGNFMDRKGYVMTGTSFLLIIPAVLVTISLINFVHGENEIISQSIKSDQVSFASEDVKRNLPLLARQSLQKLSLEIIEQNKSIDNCPEVIKTTLQEQINNLTAKYQNFNINCTVNSVQTSPGDSFFIEVNSTLTISQDNLNQQEHLSDMVSIEGLPDPLPFIKCRPYGSITHNNTRTIYGNSLKSYLAKKSVENSSFYENATSPFLIKKCPYDPYLSHGSINIMKNCQENGFYHKSNDGSCYLCRLEGKGLCIHFGFEVFVAPAPIISNNSSIKLEGPCSSDHVIFGENTYSGQSVAHNINNGTNYFLFLDDGHKSKYGVV